MTSDAPAPVLARRPPVLILRGLAALGMVAALGVGALGLVFVVEDERESTDMWDGLGTFLGLLALGGAATALVVLGVLFWLLTRRPRAGLLGVVVLAVLGLLGTVVFAVDQVWGLGGWMPWEATAAYAAGCLALLGLAGWGLARS